MKHQQQNPKNPTNRNKTSCKDTPKTIFEHFDELRSRLFLWFGFFILVSVLGYLWYDHLLSVIIKPLNQPLYYSSPIGGFEAVFGVSFTFGFLISVPILIYQIIKFIQPAFENIHNKTILLSLISSSLLLLIGISIAYFIVLPASLYFLGKFGQEQLQALITTKDYFSFVTRYLLGFAILFQLPLIMLIFHQIYPFDPKILLKYLRHIILASFIISAILTPTPDFVNQTIMATPIIVLYLISIIIVCIISQKKQPSDD